MQHDDFNFEPVRGLPEALPADEHILWQGSPNALQLAKDALKLNWIMGYFAVLTVWRIGASSADYPFLSALSHGVPFVIAGAITGLLIYGFAVVQARSTVYTLTNKRVAMRIGAALNMTLNLPYVCIGNGNASIRKSGIGTIAFELIGDDRVSYIMTWPHARPWHFSPTQPAFRAIPDAAKVVSIFAEAAETRVSTPQISRVAQSGEAFAAE